MTPTSARSIATLLVAGLLLGVFRPGKLDFMAGWCYFVKS